MDGGGGAARRGGAVGRAAGAFARAEVAALVAEEAALDAGALTACVAGAAVGAVSGGGASAIAWGEVVAVAVSAGAVATVVTVAPSGAIRFAAAVRSRVRLRNATNPTAANRAATRNSVVILPTPPRLLATRGATAGVDGLKTTGGVDGSTTGYGLGVGMRS
jgi:hypothetical protein